MTPDDDDRDGELTADWVVTPSEPAADDGEATTVLPRTPPQRSAPPAPPASPPAAAFPPPSMSPPPPGPWDPRGHSAPGPGGFPPAGGTWVPPAPPGHYPPGYPSATPAPPAPRRKRWGLFAAGAIALVAIVVAVAVFVTRGGDSSTPPLAQSSTGAPTSTTASTYPTTTSPTADIVRPTALKGLLASAAQVTQVANNVVMAPTGDQV